jgi:hypothetical protein
MKRPSLPPMPPPRRSPSAGRRHWRKRGPFHGRFTPPARRKPVGNGSASSSPFRLDPTATRASPPHQQSPHQQSPPHPAAIINSSIVCLYYSAIVAEKGPGSKGSGASLGVRAIAPSKAHLLNRQWVLSRQWVLCRNPPKARSITLQPPFSISALSRQLKRIRCFIPEAQVTFAHFPILRE